MDIPVTLTSWSLAFLPLAALLILMLVQRWGIAEAGPVAWLLAVVVAATYFQSPWQAIGFQSVAGAWSALTVLYVVWASILIYEVTREGQAFEPLRGHITRLLPDPLIQTLAFGWAFASFLQGVTGFGVPIAVCAPLLVGIGVRPLYAVIIPLIGHAWNNTFGTLAVAWLGLKQITGLDPVTATHTALYAAAFIWVLNILGGLLVCWIYAGLSGIRRGLPAIAIMSLIQGGLTVLLAPWSDVLNGFIASSTAFIAIFLIGRLPMYRQPRAAISHIFTEDRQNAETGATGVGAHSVGAAEVRRPSMTLHQAFIPYYALLVVTFGVLLIPPVKNALGNVSVALGFPATLTGLGFHSDASQASISVLTHPGSFLLAAAVIAYIAFSRMQTLKSGSLSRILKGTLEKAIPSTIAIVALIAMSKVLAGAGAVQVLAHGVAVATGPYYGVLAPFVGGLGAFMTSSNLASNLVFGSFQSSTATAVGLSKPAILAAQTVGGAAGNMIAPGNVLLGTTTAGILGREGDVLKTTLPLFLLVSVLIGLVVFFVA
ncbi:L-lactate permease [Salinisphaera sp. SPP-AMP-43]|uniref:L-lactate permease n=1 Tax=Salinisphaera sp. SPP-AMP-43 TaxID=3121288 RepID=UPI003C6E5378